CSAATAAISPSAARARWAIATCSGERGVTGWVAPAWGGNGRIGVVIDRDHRAPRNPCQRPFAATDSPLEFHDGVRRENTGVNDEIGQSGGSGYGRWIGHRAGDQPAVCS